MERRCLRTTRCVVSFTVSIILTDKNTSSGGWCSHEGQMKAVRQAQESQDTGKPYEVASGTKKK